MRLETFEGRGLGPVLKQVRAALGEDAVLVRTHISRKAGGQEVRVVAAREDEVETFRALVDGAADDPSEERGRMRPWLVALVGPPGAGKSAALLKLALNPVAFGGRTVGVITLDTYRPGAVEELTLCTQVAELPLEVVHGAGDVAGALERLAHCEVVLVDTPGRSPRLRSAGGEWRRCLQALQPDEVHMVLPAGLRDDVAEHLVAGISSLSPTHHLPSRTDELPGDLGLAARVAQVGLPVRWLSDGQMLPDDLTPARRRLLAGLGLGAAPGGRDTGTSAAGDPEARAAG
jgi:flagellar biosynthesis protein FlhF